MFKRKTFVSHSGLVLNWKIECDDLTQEDIDTLAFIISDGYHNFGSVYGIPKGGIRLAKALEKYITPGFPRLLVDDVLTTGKSMINEYKVGDIGVVIFARGKCPIWIKPIFQLAI